MKDYCLYGKLLILYTEINFMKDYCLWKIFNFIYSTPHIYVYISIASLQPHYIYDPAEIYTAICASQHHIEFESARRRIGFRSSKRAARKKGAMQILFSFVICIRASDDKISSVYIIACRAAA